MNREPEQREDPLLEADPSHLLALLNYLRPRCLEYSDLYNCPLGEIIGGCDKHLSETCETGRCLPRADHWHGDCVLAWFSSNILSWVLQAGKGNIWDIVDEHITITCQTLLAKNWKCQNNVF